MKKSILFSASMFIFLFAFQSLNAQCNTKKTSYVHKASFIMHHKDIVETASSDENFSTLVTAVATAELVSTLKSDGPFTVFAPTNAAFAKLPSGTVESLLQPSNKGKLTKILTYHVLAGKFDAEAIVNAIQLGGGVATLGTVAGGKLMAMMEGNAVVLKDENGGKSKISATDINTSNGVIHVIDNVVLPK